MSTHLDAVFAKAEELYLQGKLDEARPGLSAVACGHINPEIRRRAIALFCECHSVSVNEQEQPPVHQHESPQPHKIPVPEKRALRQEHDELEHLRAMRQQRLANNTLPNGKLPSPLSVFLEQYVRLAVPDFAFSHSLRRMILFLERDVKALEHHGTKNDVIIALNAAYEKNANVPYVIEILGALCNVLYVNDYLHREQAIAFVSNCEISDLLQDPECFSPNE